MKTFLTFAIYMVLSACGVTLYPQEFIEDSQASDTVAVIVDPALTPDEIYNDSVVVISPARESTTFLHEDHTHDFHWEQFAIPAGIATASALFVKRAQAGAGKGMDAASARQQDRAAPYKGR